MVLKQIAPILLLVSMAQAQRPWGHRQAMAPWLQGRFTEAEQRFAEERAAIPPNMLATLLIWEAEMEIERGRYARAAALLNEGKRYYSSTTNSPEMVGRRLAQLFCTTGQFALAEKTALGDAKWDGKSVDKLKINSPMDLNTIGEVYLAQGRYDEALAIFEKATLRAKKNWDSDGPEWVRAQINIARSKVASGRVADAYPNAEQAMSKAEKEWGSRGPLALDALETLGRISLAQARLSDAENAFAQVSELRKAVYGLDHLKVAETYMHLAELHLAQHDYQRAVKLGNQGLQLYQMILGGPNVQSALVLASMASIYSEAGRAADARSCYSNAISVLETNMGKDAPIVDQIRQKYTSLTREDSLK
jgi:tetratricopeptide (TPR) repeat protein